MMTTQIKQVAEGLTALRDAFGELNRMVLQEREYVIALDLESLNSQRTKLEAFFDHVRGVSDRTSQLIDAACEARKVPGDKGLSQLIESVPRPECDQLVKLQKSIRVESEAVEHALSVNRALLEDSLAFTSRTLHKFTSILKNSSSNIYGQQGRFMETSGQPQIICKEI